MHEKGLLHLKRVNRYAHMFFESFVDHIQEARKSMNSDLDVNSKEKRFLMVYCDAIKPNVTGFITTRLLYVMPYDDESMTKHHHERVSNISYSKIEKKT